jgi:hypothetical protein
MFTTNFIGVDRAAGKLLAAGANVNQQTWTTGLAWCEFICDRGDPYTEPWFS